MLLRTKQLRGTPLQAADGDIGRCQDLLFDDRHWTVRYVVADAGKWIPGRQVLVSPIAVSHYDKDKNRVLVQLTREQIEQAPSLTTDAPVSRQHEIAFYRYYGYGQYWPGAGIWGAGATPDALRHPTLAPPAQIEDANGDPCLRSIEEVVNYAIRASDGEIGHVEDFLLNQDTLTLRYMVVDTRNWLPGRKVLVAPAWVTDFDWAGRSATVNLTKTQITESPEYDEDGRIDRDYEARLHEAYRHPPYWTARGV